LKSIEKNKLCCVNKAVKEIKNITGSLALFQLNLENTLTIENASSLLIFKVRGQGHGDIVFLYIA
jgi:hypothetical protein